VVLQLARSDGAGPHRCADPFDHGPGYRVYFVHRGQTLVILLAGGDKSTQDRDIATALALAREL
jgi:putative addiction module killer protein